MSTTIFTLQIDEGNMGHFQMAYTAHITLIDLKKDLPMTAVGLFDTTSLMHLKANYLAFKMYLDKQYRLYTDCAIK